MTDAGALANRRVVRLTTRGRKSGKPRTVKVWFVVAGANRIFVQHASSAPAHWYQNLLREPAVEVDFGDGPIPARAAPIRDAEEVRDVLRRVRRKYALAWLIQLLGRKAKPLAAEIVLAEEEA
jgi:deazaflavin-dependent oxidoreductase (nitroreductase family)